MQRVVHIQHRVHVGSPDKGQHFATLRLVFLAKGTKKCAKNKKAKWLPVDGFETAVPTVVAHSLSSKSIGAWERMIGLTTSHFGLASVRVRLG